MNKGWTGKKGNGKSYCMAVTLRSTLDWNKHCAEDLGLPPRKIYIMRTLGVAPWVFETYAGYVEMFDDLNELPAFKNADIFADDITLRLSARAWDMLPLEVQDWLTASERLGCNFYFTAVNFKRVVIDFRENTDELSVVTKGWGSRRPMVGMPPVKRLWGFIHECMVPFDEYRLDSFNEANYSGGRWHWMKWKFIEMYDHTNVSLREGYPDAKAILRYCHDKKCPQWDAEHDGHLIVRHA